MHTSSSCSKRSFDRARQLAPIPSLFTPISILVHTNPHSGVHRSPFPFTPIPILVHINAHSCSHQSPFLFTPIPLLVHTNPPSCSHQSPFSFTPIPLLVHTNPPSRSHQSPFSFTPIPLLVHTNPPSCSHQSPFSFTPIPIRVPIAAGCLLHASDGQDALTPGPATVRQRAGHRRVFGRPPQGERHHNLMPARTQSPPPVSSEKGPRRPPTAVSK
eukprot:scaffold29081_cov94-Isochrysis_galbana.AAC.4